MLRIHWFLGVGLVLAIFGAGLFWSGAEVGALWAGVSLFMVAGGIGAALLATHGGKVFGFFQDPETERNPPKVLLEEITRVAQVARKDGLIAVEGERVRLQSKFFNQGLGALLDGVEPGPLRSLMELRSASDLKPFDDQERFLEGAAALAPAIGVMASVACLVPALKNMGVEGAESAGNIGSSVALALSCFMYGIGAAQLLFLPMLSSVQSKRVEKEKALKMAIDGVLGIQQGISVSVLKARLEAHLA